MVTTPEAVAPSVVTPQRFQGKTMRQKTISVIADQILALDKKDRLVVAVDWVDGSGKSCFARELVEVLREKTDRLLLLASIDGFHNPRATRYRKGKDSPIGFFEDSYNYPTLTTKLLEPFISGDAEIHLQAFDHKTDTAVSNRRKISDSNAILVFEGIFLHRTELGRYWDYSIFLKVDFATTYKRMSHRDGCVPDPADPSNQRYYRGQKDYLQSCSPEKKANVVINNSEFEHAHIEEKILN